MSSVCRLCCVRAGVVVPTRKPRGDACGGSRGTPLYGKPDWWGDGGTDSRSHGNTVRHKKLHHFVFAITLSYLSLFEYLLAHIYHDKFGTN